MPTENQFKVGMAEIKVAKGPATLTCMGLGSCIGVVMFDEQADVCGMVHILLPESFKDKPVDKPGKFANTGIPELISQMESLGAAKERLITAYAGGAQVFKFGSTTSSPHDVGVRNGEAIAKVLKSIGARILAIDIGGSTGRTLFVNSEDGQVQIRTLHGGEKTICSLKRAARKEAA